MPITPNCCDDFSRFEEMAKITPFADIEGKLNRFENNPKSCLGTTPSVRSRGTHGESSMLYPLPQAQLNQHFFSEISREFFFELILCLGLANRNSILRLMISMLTSFTIATEVSR